MRYYVNENNQQILLSETFARDSCERKMIKNCLIKARNAVNS